MTTQANAQTSRTWTCDENAKPYHYQHDLYIYRCSATFFNDVAATARNSSGFDRTPSRFPFGSRRWYRRISGELHAVDLPRSTLSTSSSEIGNTFRPSDWVLSADTSASASTRSRSGEPLLRYFRRSKFPWEPCVRKADMILREFN